MTRKYCFSTILEIKLLLIGQTQNKCAFIKSLSGQGAWIVRPSSL